MEDTVVTFMNTLQRAGMSQQEILKLSFTFALAYKNNTRYGAETLLHMQEAANLLVRAVQVLEKEHA